MTFLSEFTEINKSNNQLVQNVILLYGAPGSGKGTQAERLSKELNIPHISTGAIFRYHVVNETLLGKEINLLYRPVKVFQKKLFLMF